jgi:hypothetical protein
MKKYIGFFVLLGVLTTGFSEVQAMTLPSGYYYEQAPVINGISGPQSLRVGQIGTWKILAYDPQGGDLSYLVNWGEDAPIYSKENSFNSAMPAFKQESSFTHYYAHAGDYTVTFTVTNNNGQSVSTSLSVNVKGLDIGSSKIIISKILGPKLLRIGQTGTWQVKVKNPKEGNLSYSVDWGDVIAIGYDQASNTAFRETNKQTATFSHNYARPGNYTIRFTVTNDNGQSVSKSYKVRIKELNTWNSVWYR